MGTAINELRDAFPDTYIRSIKLGDTIQEDFLRSFFGNVNEQVDTVCKMLKADENLKGGFNAVGISQVPHTLRFDDLIFLRADNS